MRLGWPHNPYVAVEDTGFLITLPFPLSGAVLPGMHPLTQCLESEPHLMHTRQALYYLHSQPLLGNLKDHLVNCQGELEDFLQERRAVSQATALAEALLVHAVSTLGRTLTCFVPFVAQSLA